MRKKVGNIKSAFGTAYTFLDSAERYPQPRCHPETRTKLLESLWEWTRGSYAFSKRGKHLTSNIMWLYSPAGVEKSAFTQVSVPKARGRGGAFFFKHGHLSCGNEDKLFPTIAYQLSLHLPEFKYAICQVVEDDPSITNRSLSIHLQRLIIEPF
ncbi:hypothetical protein B0H19DRAFT_950309 [Mycena capillaripes]|nr:hypothetical protein B0H19DRAFT_950309 [Mycena capillaripes]